MLLINHIDMTNIITMITIILVCVCVCVRAHYNSCAHYSYTYVSLWQYHLIIIHNLVPVAI